MSVRSITLYILSHGPLYCIHLNRTPGGMLGALAAGPIQDSMGRKKSVSLYTAMPICTTHIISEVSLSVHDLILYIERY